MNRGASQLNGLRVVVLGKLFLLLQVLQRYESLRMVN